MRIAEPTLAVVAQGVKDTTLNGRTFSYGPGQFLVVSIDLPVIGRITQGSEDEPFLALVLELLDAPDDAPALAAGVEREILWRLITGPQGATVRQIGLADSRLAHLARAIRWIRSHYEDTLRVEELAALATMSVSSFHRHFRAVTTMSPIQFQKQIRLHEARARLLVEPGDVTGVGFAVGYASPSQFSREHRRMFGVPPSQDARALRPADVPSSI
jgi:transcriptional regulator GlxA family with amidase domain